MRIVHVVRQYAPAVGGLEAVVQRLAHEQRTRFGHQVEVVTLDRLFTDPHKRLPAREIVEGTAVRRLRWAGGSRYPLCPQVIAHLGDADLVHVHAIDFFFDWLAVTRWFHRKPMIASTHGGFFHTTFASTVKKLWFDTITRFSSLGYRSIVATSENDGAVFTRIAGRRVAVIENGAELDRFHDASSVAIVPTLLYFGRWSTNKGLLDLITLTSHLHRHDQAWRLMIAGRPHDLTRSELQTKIDALGLGDVVELYESPSDADLRILMARSSYFACLSRHEGFGIAAIEAMSAGLLPVLSDIPPFRKIVRDSGSGLLLPLGGDSEAAAAGIVALHASRVASGSRDRASIMAFTARYDWSLVADRYEALYRGTPPVGTQVARALP